jgi:hypothetical protein
MISCKVFFLEYKWFIFQIYFIYKPSVWQSRQQFKHRNIRGKLAVKANIGKILTREIQLQSKNTNAKPGIAKVQTKYKQRGAGLKIQS